MRQAFETRERYERSRIAIGAPEFDERDTFPELVDFLNIDLDNLTTDLEKKCKNCRVAITGANKDLKDLDLEEFVCTDFDSISGLDSYPDRDCKAVDYDYALEPDAMKAPCCLNQSLVQASMAIMTWTKWAPEFLDRDFLTPGVISIGDLVAIDDRFNDGPPNFGAEGLALWKREVFTRINQDLPPMVQRAGSYLYVNSAVDTGFIAQVIISREQRMVRGTGGLLTQCPMHAPLHDHHSVHPSHTVPQARPTAVSLHTLVTVTGGGVRCVVLLTGGHRVQRQLAR